MDIRLANIDDAESIRNIYKYYVLNTAISFEYDLPSIDEFKDRIQNTLKKYPYLVAIENNTIIGYAYASGFHSRKAYEHDCELSIYIDKDHRKKGIGKNLYCELERILALQNVYGVHACITYPDVEDEYLTFDSKNFHEKMNFKLVGKHEKCGYKFNKWYNIIWMDKDIKEREINANEFIPFSNIKI